MAFVAFMIGRKKYVKILLPDEVSTPLHYFIFPCPANLLQPSSVSAKYMDARGEEITM